MSDHKNKIVHSYPTTKNCQRVKDCKNVCLGYGFCCILFVVKLAQVKYSIGAKAEFSVFVLEVQFKCLKSKIDKNFLLV